METTGQQEAWCRNRELLVRLIDREALADSYKAKASLADAYVHYRETLAYMDDHLGRYDAVAAHDIALDELDAAYAALQQPKADQPTAIDPEWCRRGERGHTRCRSCRSAHTSNLAAGQ